jgi:hypothetical protein
MDADRLYREVGETIQVSQMLETSLRALVTVLNRRFDAGIDAQQIILAEDRNTLGRLIEQFKRVAELNGDFITLLADALEARNYHCTRIFSYPPQCIKGRGCVYVSASGFGQAHEANCGGSRSCFRFRQEIF